MSKKTYVTIYFKPAEKPIYDALHRYLEENYTRYRGNISHLGVDAIQQWLKAQGINAAIERGK